MDKHYIDNRIKEELDRLEANPPVEAWLAITEELDRRSRKRRLPVLFGMAASLAALAVVVMSLWLILQPADTPELASGEINLPQAMASLSPPLLEESSLRGLQRSPHSAGTYALPPPEMATYQPDTPKHAYLARINTGPGLQVPQRSISGAGFYQTAVATSAQSDTDKAGLQLVSEKHPSHVPGKIRLGVHFAPRQSHRALARNNDFNALGIPFESLEEGIMTYGMGMQITYELSSALSVQSGLNHVSTGQHVRDILTYKHPGDLPLYETNKHTGIIYHPQTVITSQGNIRFDDPYHYFADKQSHRVTTNKKSMAESEIKSLRQSHNGLTQVFQYIEIPVTVRYRLLDGLVGLYVKGGVSGNYLLQNDVFPGTNTYQDAIGETFGVRKINLSAIGGLSLDMALTGRLTIHLEPTAQIFLNPVLQQGLMPGHAFPYSYSLQTGISYGF